MKIADIYSEYTIMPSLQLHMLRVSAVAKFICVNTTVSVNTPHILSACLLHDMGNILKFNLDLFPEFLQPEGKDYWQGVKDSFQKKYGPDEHEATIQIAKELGVENRVIDLIDAFQFSLAVKNNENPDIEKKICAYADMRVEPHNIVSLKDRLKDGRKRFKLNKKNIKNDEQFYNTMAESLQHIETELFSNSAIQPSDITTDKVERYIVNLRQFDIVVTKN